MFLDFQILFVCDKTLLCAEKEIVGVSIFCAVKLIDKIFQCKQ